MPGESRAFLFFGDVGSAQRREPTSRRHALARLLACFHGSRPHHHPRRIPWRAAPIRVPETIFAIGDVHGCDAQLAALLETFSERAADSPARLIFLGDLICRGPSSLAALKLWASPEFDARFTTVHRLTGNHEQLLMLSIGGGATAQAAHTRWMTIDGVTFVDELRRATGRPDAPLTRDLLLDAAGHDVVARLDALEHNVRLGNMIFVHGGIDPSIDPDAALAAPFSAFGGNHWAWINQPFLAWRGGFGGTLVIHGHTPPEKHRQMSGEPDPHVFQFDRLCLDGGSAVTGIVAGAQIENGRYRLFKAATQTSTPHIRPASADDAVRCRAIARAAYAKYVPRIGREPAPMGADFEADIAAQRVVVIATADEINGYMVAWPEAGAYVIENIGVDPDCQGEGLGRRLIEHAAAEARRLRLPALTLYTNAAMTENLAMYAHIGFAETHRVFEDGFHRVYLRWDLPANA